MEHRISTIEIEPQPEDEKNVDCKITEEETISQATRSSTRPLTSKDAVENDDLLCFFCGKRKSQNLRKASTFKTDKKVRKCSMAVQDFDLLAKLSEGDMIAQDAMYHPFCLLAFYKKAKSEMTILHQFWMKKKNFMEWFLQSWRHSFNRKETG